MRKVLILFFSFLSFSLSASTYYIDDSGNDNTGNGSASNPWRSLYKACNSVKTPGDIIHVNAGTYIEIRPSILAVNVSIEGEGVNSLIVSRYQSSNNYDGIIQLISGTNTNQHISNIKLDGDKLTGYQAISIYDRDNVSIHDCVIVDFYLEGIDFGGGTQTGNRVFNNIITNCAGFTNDEHACLSINDNAGMHIFNNYFTQNSRPDGQNGVCIESWQGLKDCKIYNNTIIGPVRTSTKNNWSFAIEFWKTQGGIEIYDNNISGLIDFGKDVYKGNYAYGLDFHHNTVGWDELQSEHTDGIQFEQTIESVIIRNNLFKNLETPIYFCQYNYTDDYVKDIYIYNNLLVNVGMRNSNYGAAIFFESGPVPPIYEDNINIWNNTIIADPAYPTDYGIWIPSCNKVTNLSIRNNIIVGFTDAPIYANLNASSGSVNLLSIENNLLYNNGNNNTPKYVNITPTNITYKNNIVDNPDFVSETDFHLSAASPAIGSGIPISNITTDFEGSSVPNPPNMGCYSTIAGVSSPSYLSSYIENGTPSLLEMNYNLALASVIPTTSAFSVQVNSTSSSVTSVSISGTKVLLTLASPVVYGNVVTVSYTVPSSNPLQTPAGGKAATFTAKSVTNRISPPPAIPAYVSSAVENASPSVLEMTYNLALANKVPATSSFSVMVNSVARAVNSVSISGAKILLSLSSPVVYGNTVTVAYSKPSANPIQTPSGGQAASISAQNVSNRVNAVTTQPVAVTPPVLPNTPPVVVVNYIASNYSGFIGGMNASGSYDKEKDKLTFTWKVPGNIPVSSASGPIIEYLAPVVDANQAFEFTVTVSDGKTSQSKTVSFQILPYQPELETAEVISVEASNFKSPYEPDNILDGNKGTLWSASGTDQWLILELKTPFKIHHLKLAFQPGQMRESYFEIYGSNDEENWEIILPYSKSCAFSGDLQVFDLPVSKTEKEFKYIKLAGLGNSTDTWNYISEFRIFGYERKNPSDYENLFVKIYPNPARELVNILIDEPTFSPDFIKILSLAGKILYDNIIDPGVRQLQIPVDFKEGIYVVQMGTSNITMFTQKLIVIR